MPLFQRDTGDNDFLSIQIKPQMDTLDGGPVEKLACYNSRGARGSLHHSDGGASGICAVSGFKDEKVTEYCSTKQMCPITNRRATSCTVSGSGYICQ